MDAPKKSVVKAATETVAVAILLPAIIVTVPIDTPFLNASNVKLALETVEMVALIAVKVPAHAGVPCTKEACTADVGKLIE